MSQRTEWSQKQDGHKRSDNADCDRDDCLEGKVHVMEKRQPAIGSNSQDRQVLSRRGFLGRSALVGAGLAVGSSLWNASSALASEQPTARNSGSGSALSAAQAMWPGRPRKSATSPSGAWIS